MINQVQIMMAEIILMAKVEMTIHSHMQTQNSEQVRLFSRIKTNIGINLVGFLIISFMFMFCRWLFVLLCFFLLVIVLSVLRFTDYDYLFGILDLQILIASLVS